MKTILVVNASTHSDMDTEMVGALSLPPQTEVTIMTVVPEHTFLGGITLGSNFVRTVLLLAL